MKKYHNYSLLEIENMLPWERLVHVDQLRQIVQIEKEKIREESLRRNG